MAQQPLMNARIIMMMGRRRNRKNSRWISFSTLHSASPTSTSSSNSDTESTGSLIDDNNGVTLGSLLGVSSILELQKRLLTRRAKKDRVLKRNNKVKKFKSKLRLLLCLSSRHDSENNHSPSLAQFLALERRA